jgi:gluconolactonase
MRAVSSLRLIAGLFAAGHALAQPAVPATPPSRDDLYVPGPDSLPQAGVPKGKIFTFTFDHSKIYPATTRTISVYVPAQYRADRPACVYVGLDALWLEAPVVFDNLINKQEMPVTIGVGVSAGSVDSASPPANPRFNRSFEFDGLSGDLARFVLEEIFPEVERRLTPDGLPIKLSINPNDRAVGGASTGGIGSFTLAWERPDAFRRVFTAIGTFVGMRGGDHYPVLVRKTEPKPIRIFMQDGSQDAQGELGDWWMSNQTMERALEFSGYQVEHVWGEGIHSLKHPTTVFPDAMRFLWKDWPQPVLAQTAKSQNATLAAILDPAASWELVSAAGGTYGDLAVNPRGEVFFRDSASLKMRKFSLDGKISDEPTIPADQVFAFAADGSTVTIAGLNATCLTVANNGDRYATDANADKVWLIKSDGTKIQLDEKLTRPTGIALSPDGLWLAVMENGTHWGYSYRVQPDGAVDGRQQFYWAHIPDRSDDSGAGGMCMDREGRPYVATRLGIQVFDRNGRARAILTLPSGEAQAVCFGGATFDTLFATSGDKLYRRKLKAVGAPNFLPPITLPPGNGA